MKQSLTVRGAVLLFLPCLGWASPLWIPNGSNLIPVGLKQSVFAQCCGSMSPAIHGGETFYYEEYAEGKTKFRKGDWIWLRRENDGMFVVHEVTALNSRAVYTSGINNHYSDGWSPRKNIIGVVRLIVRP